MPHNDTTHQPGNSESQHGNASQHGAQSKPDDAHRAPTTTPGQSGPDLNATLSEINSNMGTMTALFKQLVADGSSDMDNRPSRSSRKRRQRFPSPVSSESEDNTEPMGSNKRPRCDDELSLSPSEADVEHLLDMHDSEAKGAELIQWIALFNY